jgi:hypothetical protein
MDFDTELCNNVDLKRLKQICGTILRTLAYNIMAITTLLYGSECRTLTEQQKGRLEVVKMYFLRVTSRYQMTDHTANC